MTKEEECWPWRRRENVGHGEEEGDLALTGEEKASQ